MLSRPALDELLTYPGRPTRALIDLDIVRENVRQLKAHVGETVDLMAVVKADGYGHGAVMVAREALAGGASWLGVATVAEGIELRDAGVDEPILVLGPIHRTEVETAEDGVLDITVGDESLARALINRASDNRSLPRLHLKVDTGMHRYGLAPDQALAMLSRLQGVAPNALFALCSHLAVAEEPSGSSTLHQVRQFRELTDLARRIRPDLAVHIANSSATVAGLAEGSSIARVGIAIYGCGIPAQRALAIGLLPAMSIVSRIMRVHELQVGDGVSYGHTYIAEVPERVGLIPIGYADGYPRSLSGLGWMSVGGRDRPVRGRVCMDQVVIGNLSADVSPGEWVGVAGSALGAPAWDEVAKAAGTISYELLTSVGRRVARLYHRSGRLVAVRDERGRLQDLEDTTKAPTSGGQ